MSLFGLDLWGWVALVAFSIIGSRIDYHIAATHKHVEKISECVAELVAKQREAEDLEDESL